MVKEKPGIKQAAWRRAWAGKYALGRRQRTLNKAGRQATGDDNVGMGRREGLNSGIRLLVYRRLL